MVLASGAYAHSCAALGLHAFEKACPLLVPLVEEGWIDHPVTAEVTRIYLTEALDAATQRPHPGPRLYPLPSAQTRPRMHIVDAAATARAAASLLPALPVAEPVTCRFFATDSIEKFRRLGAKFLGQPLRQVTLVDLGG